MKLILILVVIGVLLVSAVSSLDAGQMLDGMMFYMHKSGGAGDVLPVGALLFGTEALTFGAGNFLYF